MRKALLILVPLFLLLAACESDDTLKVEDLPEGDAARGEQLFAQKINGTPACNSCHILGEGGVAPDLTGYGQIAGNRKEGESAEEYTFHSIVSPGRHIVDGFSNVMYRQYNEKLSPQQIADLIAYLLTL